MKSTGRFTPELRGLMRESYDECQSCGSKLPKEIAAFAGYDKTGAPLYVGDVAGIVSTNWRPIFIGGGNSISVCAPDQQLWRYMDFARFVSMLEQRAIYLLAPMFWGTPSKVLRESRSVAKKWDMFYLDFFREYYSEPCPSTGAAFERGIGSGS